NDQLVGPIGVEVGEPDRMSPAQLLVDDVAVPKLPRLGGLGVDDHLVAVPGLDSGDHLLASLEAPLLDLAGAALALGIVLVARAELHGAPLRTRVAPL